MTNLKCYEIFDDEFEREKQRAKRLERYYGKDKIHTIIERVMCNDGGQARMMPCLRIKWIQFPSGKVFF